MIDEIAEAGFTAQDEAFMRLALAQAETAASKGEVPVGAVLVAQGQVLAASSNAPITEHDPCGHAEIRALRAAGQSIANYRLPDSTLYVTLEPCMMCCGAIVHARVKRLVFAAHEPKAGGVESVAALLSAPYLNHKVRWQGGLLATHSAALLSSFFAKRREMSKRDKNRV